MRRKLLQPRDRRRQLAEIDPAVEAAGQRLAVAGAAESLQALARDDIDLIDAVERIGPVPIDLEGASAQPGERAGRRVGGIEDDPLVLGPAARPGHRKITL